jgi:hypothetical protein
MSVLRNANGRSRNANAPAEGASHGLSGLAISVHGTSRPRIIGQGLPYRQPTDPRCLHAMPSEARKTVAETGLALEKRLNRATLCHLRPGPEMEPAHDAGGDPSIHTKREKGLEKRLRTILRTRYSQGYAQVAGINPLTGKAGPAPAKARDGDKLQARQRVNVEVRSGYRVHPNKLPCTDCGHVYVEGGPHHEYDHYKGYAAVNHLEVEAVCIPCHVARDSLKARQVACVHGHPFTPENTRIRANGTRECLACRRRRDLARRPAAWWREYRIRRKARG